MLFCVTTRGRERIFSSPRDSAMVRMASMRMLLLEFWNPIPLVGLVTGRFENNGIWLMLVGEGAVFPIIVYSGLPPNVPIGEVPTLPAPPTVVVPLPHPKPNWVPMSRAKLRVAAPPRASISLPASYGRAAPADDQRRAT